MLEGSKCIVTGGAGFIGSHLTRTLLASGVAEVVVVDNFRYSRKENIVDRGTSGRLTLKDFDIGVSAPGSLHSAFEGASYLFHLAAEKHNQSKDHPSRYFSTNINGTYDILDLAARSKVKRVVFSSSLYAYGRTNYPPMQEIEISKPDTIYGLSKLAGENLLRYFRREYGLSTIALRYFFIFGPRQFAGQGYRSVIIKNFDRIIRGQAPIINGDGQQSLDYLYVDDVVNATIRAALVDNLDDTLNIGSGTDVSICDLIELMMRVANCKLGPIFEKSDWTAGTHRLCDNTNARLQLGWQPTVPLEVGLDRTLQWMSHEKS